MQHHSGVATFLDELATELAVLFDLERSSAPIGRIVGEVGAHLEDSIADLIHEGRQSDAAIKEAISRFGSPQDVARAYRAHPAPRFVQRDDSAWRRAVRFRGEATMSSIWQELRFAIRGLVRAPGYAAAFVLTLGLGIGANTAIFSVVNGVLLRPLPHRDGDRLVYLRHSARLAGISNALFSVPEIIDYREQASSFEGVAEFSALTFTMLDLDEPRRVRAGIVTGNYFEVMGLRPVLGRVISEQDDGEGADPVIVLTHDFWHRVFGADAQVVGRTVRMNGRTVEIVGVLEPAPPYPERTDLYVNMISSPHHLDATMQHDRMHRMTEVLARLTPAATVESASHEVQEISGRLHAEYPESYDASQGYGVSVTSLRDQLARRARPTMLMLLGVAAFVLIIACANVANLTLARVMRRHHELAVRASLGASGGVIRRQLLIENLVPSLAGAVFGSLVALFGVDMLSAYAARYSARASEITVDSTVFLVAIAVGVGAACLFALIPRLPISTRKEDDGQTETRTTAGAAGRRMQRVLVVSQISVCFVLLIGAGLLLRTLYNLQRADGGLDPENVLTMEIPSSGRTLDEYRTFYGTILERVAALPGVRDAALSNTVPLRGMPTGLVAFLAAMEFQIEGHTAEPGAPQPRAAFRPVSTGYFRTVGMTLARGRPFESTDHVEAAKVVIINQAMAERYFPDRDPVGQRLRWTDDVIRFIGVSDEWRTIVGVVSDTWDYGVDQDVPHMVFHPFQQEPGAFVLFVRTQQPESIVGPAVGIVRDIEADQPVENIATLVQVRADAIAPQRLNAALVGAFALLAMAIAAVGVAGVLAFNVSQRTHELGIRAALGADRQRLVSMVLEEGVLLAAIGLVIGGAASVVMSQLLASLLYEVDPTDGVTFVGVALLLITVALFASWMPARRASRIDPVRALRTE